MIRSILAIGAAALTCVAVAGCGSSGSNNGASSSNHKSSSTSTTGSSGVKAVSSDSSDSASATKIGTATGTVDAKLSEFTIKLSKTTMPSGTYTFTADNVGAYPHAISIDGPGVEDQATSTLQPGSSGKVTVKLAPGTYEVYCPVDGHKAKGMDTHITVTA